VCGYGDQVIELRLPSQTTEDNFRGETCVARVEVFGVGNQEVGSISALLRLRQYGKRSFPRGRDHLLFMVLGLRAPISVRLVGRFRCEPPVGKGRPHLNTGVIGSVLSNWAVAGTLNARSGLPMNVTIDRPDLISGIDPYLRDTNSLRWLNPAAFAAPRPGNYGNLGRNALRGPGFSQLDVMVSRKIKVTDVSVLEFRPEIFNVFNRTNFANAPSVLPNVLRTLQPGQAFSTAAAPQFGVLTSTVGRNVGVGTSRPAQVALRLSF
jgi:hypothetical protein